MNIRELLRRRAQERNVPLPRLLQHYAMERFLYRLSLSPVADKFFLKGGMLLMGIGAGSARTTMDIDLLGRLSNSPDSVKKAMLSIIRTKPGVAAVARTFDRRNTDPAEYIALLKPEYSAEQQPEWAAYVRKLKAATFQKKTDVLMPSRDMREVLAEIIAFLEPVMQESTLRRWNAGKGWM